MNLSYDHRQHPAFVMLNDFLIKVIPPLWLTTSGFLWIFFDFSPNAVSIHGWSMLTYLSQFIGNYTLMIFSFYYSWYIYYLTFLCKIKLSLIIWDWTSVPFKEASRWGGGREVQEGGDIYLWLIRFVVWQKPAQHFKAIILQLKNKQKKEASRNEHFLSFSPQFIFPPHLFYLKFI